MGGSGSRTHVRVGWTDVDDLSCGRQSFTRRGTLSSRKSEERTTVVVHGTGVHHLLVTLGCPNPSILWEHGSDPLRSDIPFPLENIEKEQGVTNHSLKKKKKKKLRWSDSSDVEISHRQSVLGTLFLSKCCSHFPLISHFRPSAQSRTDTRSLSTTSVTFPVPLSGTLRHKDFRSPVPHLLSLPCVHRSPPIPFPLSSLVLESTCTRNLNTQISKVV